MLKILIVDDNEIHLIQNKNYLIEDLNHRHIQYEIDEVTTLNSFNQMINSGKAYDMILADIDFHEENIFDSIQNVNRINPDVQIIYITGYIDFVRDVSETNFTYFILKDDVQKKLPKAITKALLNIQDEESFVFKENGNTVILKLKNILFFERRLHKTIIYTKHKNYVIPLKLQEIYDEINHSLFIICHQSFMFNITHLTSYTRSQIVIDMEYEIPISRKYIPSVKESILQYIYQKNS